MEVKEFLRLHNYLVIVKATPDGCQATFPNNAVVTYNIEGNGIHSYLDNKDLGTCRIAKYAIRPTILAAILKLCQDILYNPVMIEFQVDDKESDENSFFAALNLKLTKKELEKESILRQLFVEAYVGGFDEQYTEIAKSLDVSTGYKEIRDIFVGDL